MGKVVKPEPSTLAAEWAVCLLQLCPRGCPGECLLVIAFLQPWPGLNSQALKSGSWRA